MREVAAARPTEPLGFLADRLAGIPLPPGSPVDENRSRDRASANGGTSTAAWLGQHLWPGVQEALTVVMMSEVSAAATATQERFTSPLR